jgi:hypothetical protein
VHNHREIIEELVAKHLYRQIRRTRGSSLPFNRRTHKLGARFNSTLVMVLPELHLGGSALNHAERHRNAYSGEARSAWAVP